MDLEKLALGVDSVANEQLPSVRHQDKPRARQVGYSQSIVLNSH